ncbi:MAG TPA: hypothetical protein VNN20_10155 [Thermodesulfobacteriota bacterium]|nr:hypothetical protein [Thermodesulfobacteriota bacterium]
MKLEHVECYSGYKGNERPLSFSLGDRKFTVEELLDQWYGTDYTYFKVRADDDNIYILKYVEHEDEWSLEFFKAKEKT